MASKYPQGSGRPRGDELHHLDKVSFTNELTKTIPAPRILLTILFVTFFYDENNQAVLYHCQIDNERRTFLKGKCHGLGLHDPEEEYECEELRGKSLVQAVITTYGPFGVVYALDAEGVLWSLGANNWSQLGRPTSNTVSTTFGQVSIVEPILELACGMVHCLVRTAERVFAFGYSELGQTGVRIGEPVGEPTEIYRGTGDAAPSQIATGEFHSAILTRGGEVYTFGEGDFGKTGHGGTKRIEKPTRVKALKHRVDQIGCTTDATFFLAEGKMFGCGYNSNSSLGVGHNESVTSPTQLNTDGHIITSFRCSYSLVVAYTELRDALVWGMCHDKVIIKAPQVERLEFPRDFFSRGRYKDTGGNVYPDIQRYRLEAMKDLSAKMVQLKMEITGSGESYGHGGVSSAEREAERLAENGRLMEENSTLHTQLTSTEAKRAALETKSTQQQKAYEDLLSEHKAILSGHEALRREHGDEKKRHNELKAERTKEMSTHVKLLAEHKSLLSKIESLQKEHASIRNKYDDATKKYEELRAKQMQEMLIHEGLLTEHKDLLFNHETLKNNYAALHNTYDDEKEKHNTLKKEQMKAKSAQEDLMAQHTVVLSDRETLKKEFDSIHNTYEEEKAKHNMLKTAHQELQSNCKGIQEKLDTLSKLISLPILHVVVNMVGKKWDRLGIKLGVPDFMLEQIDYLCSTLPDKAFATINKWYELAPEEATANNLADCLEYIGRKDIGDKIRTTK